MTSALLSTVCTISGLLVYTYSPQLSTALAVSPCTKSGTFTPSSSPRWRWSIPVIAKLVKDCWESS